jgi:hypothetical protein
MRRPYVPVCTSYPPPPPVPVPVPVGRAVFVLDVGAVGDFDPLHAASAITPKTASAATVFFTVASRCYVEHNVARDRLSRCAMGANRCGCGASDRAGVAVCPMRVSLAGDARTLAMTRDLALVARPVSKLRQRSRAPAPSRCDVVTRRPVVMPLGVTRACYPCGLSIAQGPDTGPYRRRP